MSKFTIHNGNSLEVLKQYPDNHFDSIITDPPYGLSFMGKKWDYDVPSIEIWKEAYRVLKPGGHLLAFFGTRTYHRGVVNIEDAGFEIRDQVMWVYGSGFPKSHNIQKDIIKRYEKCLLSNNVKHVIQKSKLFQVELEEGKIDFAVAYAEILPEESPALIIRIGKAEDINAKTVILLCELKKTNTDLNTILSWSELWEDHSKNTKKFITETKLKTIIDLTTWNYIQNLLTQNYIIEEEMILNGYLYPVNTVMKISNEELKNMKGIPMLFVADNVTQTFLKNFEGTGSALKPANEPIVVARKPLEEDTVAENVLKHGTGALNIDESRIQGGGPSSPRGSSGVQTNIHEGWKRPWMNNQKKYEQKQEIAMEKLDKLGRWPANFIHDGSDEVTKLFPETKSGAMKYEIDFYEGQSITNFLRGKSNPNNQHGDFGSAARFFYCAKTSKEDREEGLKEFDAKFTPASEFRPNHMEKTLEGENGNPYGRWTPLKNNHPTVKPTKLMEYLVNLVTPKGGTVLDPFMGSGSTGKACMNKSFNFVGIDLDENYCKIAQARIEYARKKNSNKLTNLAKKK